MAPQKSAVLSQNLQADQVSSQKQRQQQTAKPRNNNKKAKQQSIASNKDQQQQQQQNQQQASQPSLPSKNGTLGAPDLVAHTNGQAKAVDLSGAEKYQELNSPQVVPAERTTIKNKQLNNNINVPSNNKEEPKLIPKSRKIVPATAVITTSAAASKQSQFEEEDNIDAGIELDGSSNSGSSVKDISEDPSKSSSASPVMSSQTNNGVCVSYSTNLNGQQVASSEPFKSAASLCPAPDAPKKLSVTKQQLAEARQVIDADEQQLQNKLESKQKKSADSLEISAKLLGSADKKASTSITQIDSPATDKAGLYRRKFSSQSSQDGQSGSLCKVCEQHVYQMERVLAEKSLYHKQCFRCHQCNIQLRVDNYSSHEGQVYCKIHHRQLFQPQVKLDNDDDSNSVAKSNSKPVDDYLLQRGRLSELTFLFLNQSQEGNRQRQMIICENEPAQLSEDVVRSNSKVDDGIDRMNVNLNNILQKFEKATGETSQPSSPSVIIEKPSFNLKKTLMAFESGQATRYSDSDSDDATKPNDSNTNERPIVRKLTNIDNLFKNQANLDKDDKQQQPVIRRSGSLMKKLQKFESRIAGQQVENDDDDDKSSEEIEDSNNNNGKLDDNDQNDLKHLRELSSGLVASKIQSINDSRQSSRTNPVVKPRLASIKLSSLKDHWESGDIVNRSYDDEDDVNGQTVGAGATNNVSSSDTVSSPIAEKNEELSFIREQLARKKLGESGSVRNIYENAIREAQLQQEKQQASTRRQSSDLSTISKLSNKPGKLVQTLQSSVENDNNTEPHSPSSASQVKLELEALTNKANKLKERFELGLIKNSSRDDSDQDDETFENPAITKLEQIRRDKLEDLSVFTDGEIKAREARSLFQQIDQQLTAESTSRGVAKRPSLVPNSRSLASISASMRAKLTNQMNNSPPNGTHIEGQQQAAATTQQILPRNDQQQQQKQQQPIRLLNNVKN